MRKCFPVRCLTLVLGVFASLAWGGWLAVGLSASGQAAEADAAAEQPLREIYVPTADLDALLGGDVERVFVTRAEYEDLVERARQPDPTTPAPEDVVVLSADYEVVLAGERALLQGVVQVEVLSAGLQQVALPLEGVGLRAAQLDGGAAMLARDEAGVPQLFLSGVGLHSLVLELTMPVTTSAAQQAVSFRVPTPAATRIRVQVPGNVEIRSGVLSRSFDAAAGVTQFEVPPARGTQQLVMSLNNRTRALQRVVSARSVLIDEVTQGYRRLHATMSMRVLRGGVPSFSFRLPTDLEVTDVVAPQVAQWRVREGDDSRVLEVQLHEPATDLVTLAITAAGGRPSPGGWTMQQIEPLDVVGQVAVLGLLLDERLEAEQLSADGAFPIDVSVLQQAVPESVFTADPTAPRIRPVAAWLATESGATITAELTRPQATVDVNAATLLSLSEEKQTLRSTITLQPQAEPIKAVTLEVPAGWDVTSVRGEDGTPLPFTPAIGSQTRGVRVRFGQQVAASTTMRFLIEAESVPSEWLADWSEQEVLYPMLRIAGGRFREGAVAVTASGDLAVRPDELGGLIPLARREREEVGLSADEGTFAYRLSSADHQARFLVTRRQPRVTARTFTFTRIGNEVVATHAEVLYDIDRAATRQLSFRLPVETPPLISLRGLGGAVVSEFSSREIEGDRIWTAQLAARSRGTARLAIDFEQPLSLGAESLDLALPCVAAEGVDYQSAAVAVEGNPEIDVTLSSDGRRIDVGELVDAEYQVGRRLLGVFGFVGTAEVTAEVTRRPGYALPEAITQRVGLITLQGTAGVAQTAARYELRTNAAFLQVTLPAGATLWSVSIDGRPALPQRDGDAVLVSLPPAADGASIRDISIVYETEQPISPWLQEVAHEAPQLAVRDEGGPVVEVPVADVVWQLVVPEGMRVIRSGGSVAVPQGSADPWPLQDFAGVLLPLGGGVRAFSWRPLVESAVPQAPMSQMIATDAPRASTAVDADMAPEAMGEEEAKEALAKTTPDAPPVVAGKIDRLVEQPQSELSTAGVVLGDDQVSIDGAVVLNQPALVPRARQNTWAFEGVRSLPIALEDQGRAYRYQSLGGETRLTVTLAEESRLVSGAVGLAAAVVFSGLTLLRSSWRKRLLAVTLVLVPLMAIPIAVELVRGFDLHALFEPACLAVVLWIPVFGLVDAVQVVKRGGRPRATGLAAGLLLAGVFSAAESWADQPAAEPGVAVSDLSVAELLQLLASPTPVQIPDDALVIPYDPAGEMPPTQAEKVLVPYESYLRLKQRVQELVEGPPAGEVGEPPLPFAYGNARYAARLAERGDLVVSGRLEVMVYGTGMVEVPLPLGGGVLTQASLDEQPARLRVLAPQATEVPQQAKQNLQPQPPQEEVAPLFLLSVEGKGPHQLVFEIRFSPTQRGGWRRVEGQLPAPPATALSVAVPASDTEVRLSGVKDQAAYETTQADQILETALVDQGRFALEWRSRVAAAAIDEALTVDTLGIFDIREDGTQLTWQLALDIRQGQRESWRLVVPSDVLVEEVRGPNVRGWETTERDGQQEIDVTLLEPATGTASLLVRLSRAGNLVFAEDQPVALPFLTVPAAALHQGVVVIRRGPLVDLRVEEARGFARDEAPQERIAELLANVSEESPLPLRSFQTYRFASENVALRLIASGARSEMDVQGQTLLRIAERETTFETQLGCEIEARPRHALEVELPAGLTLETVTCPGLSHWSLAEQGRLLRIDLGDGASGSLPITLRGQLPAVEMASADGEGGGSVEPPAFVVRGARRQSGVVVVQVDPSMSVEVRELSRAEVIPLSRTYSWLADAQRPSARLALLHRGAMFSAKLQVARRRPVVTAVAVTNVQVTPLDIDETMLLRFEIREAGIREVVFLVPDSMADADVEAPLLLEKIVTPAEDVAGMARVRLTFQDDVMGRLAVLVHASRGLPSTDYRVPMATIETGVTQQRYAVLETSGRDEVVVSANTGFREVNRQAAEWRQLASILPGQTTMAYVARSDESTPTLELSLRERALVETAGARVGLAVTVLSVDAHGEYRGSQEYRVDNKTEQLLEVELPQGASLWSAMVAGESVKPTPLPGSEDGRRVGIPLIKTQAGDLDYGVILKYGGNLGNLDTLAVVGFPLMTTLNINVEQSQVRLRLPASHRWFDFGGTLRQTDSADDLVADFVAYQNKKLEQLLQVASSESNDVFSRVRASTNARQLGESLQGYRDAYRSSSRSGEGNAKLQKALSFNESIVAETKSQAPPVAAGLDADATRSNAAQLRSYFTQQDVERGQNVVNELALNFDVSGLPEASDRGTIVEQAQQQASGQLNRQWLSANQFGRGSQISDAEGRVAGDVAATQGGRLGDVRGKRAVELSDESRPTADFKGLKQSTGGESDVALAEKVNQIGQQRQDNQLFDQVQRYQLRLEEQNRDKDAMPNAAAPAGGVAFERQLASEEGAEQGRRFGNGQPASGRPEEGESLGLSRGGIGGMGGGIGGGSFGSGGYAGAAGQQQESSAASGPSSEREREERRPQRQPRGLVSLDVEMPQRGQEFLFTTPRGDLSITARAVDATLVDRGLRLAYVSSGLVAVWLGWALAVATWRRLGVRAGGLVLLLTGVVSVVTLVLPVVGLIAAVVGGTLVVATFRRHTTAIA